MNHIVEDIKVEISQPLGGRKEDESSKFSRTNESTNLETISRGTR
jgi:hypothetical protein